jgi:hypothetical protein
VGPSGPPGGTTSGLDSSSVKGTKATIPDKSGRHLGPGSLWRPLTRGIAGTPSTPGTSCISGIPNPAPATLNTLVFVFMVGVPVGRVTRLGLAARRLAAGRPEIVNDPIFNKTHALINPCIKSLVYTRDSEYTRITGGLRHSEDAGCIRVPGYTLDPAIPGVPGIPSIPRFPDPPEVPGCTRDHRKPDLDFCPAGLAPAPLDVFSCGRATIPAWLHTRVCRLDRQTDVGALGECICCH